MDSRRLTLPILALLAATTPPAVPAQTDGKTGIPPRNEGRVQGPRQEEVERLRAEVDAFRSADVVVTARLVAVGPLPSHSARHGTQELVWAVEDVLTEGRSPRGLVVVQHAFMFRTIPEPPKTFPANHPGSFPIGARPGTRAMLCLKWWPAEGMSLALSNPFFGLRYLDMDDEQDAEPDPAAAAAIAADARRTRVLVATLDEPAIREFLHLELPLRQAAEVTLPEGVAHGRIKARVGDAPFATIAGKPVVVVTAPRAGRPEADGRPRPTLREPVVRVRVTKLDIRRDEAFVTIEIPSEGVQAQARLGCARDGNAETWMVTARNVVERR